MALNEDALGSALASAVTGLSSDDKKDPVKIWKAIAGEIIKHLKSSATVEVPAAGLSAPNGPCTGTATGRIL